MYKLIIILFLLSCKVGPCQSNSTGFEPNKFTRFTSKDLIFNDIVTDSPYVYWECIYNPTSMALKDETRQIVERKGELKFGKLTKIHHTKSGFFTACGPGFCSYYILAIKKDKSIDLIKTPMALESFIGKVDNIEEVKLIIKNNGYSIDLDRLETGSYQERTQDYLLNICKLDDFCLPTEKKPVKGIKAVLTKMVNLH